MDVLSDILQSLRLSGAIFLRGEFRSPWGVSAPTAAEMAQLLRPGMGYTLVFHIVAKGRCWIQLDTGSAGLLQAPGVLLMPHGHAHVLADEGGRRTKPVAKMLPPPPWAEFPIVSEDGGGEETKIICGYLHFANVAFASFLKDLPDLIMIGFPASQTPTGLQAILEYTMQEAEAARPGTVSLVFRLAELFFIEVLRHHVQDLSVRDRGWFAALGDPMIARALHLLHKAPTDPWTVEELARRAATSRSTLAGRFKRRFGHGPMEYLTKWRIRAAAGQLAETKDSIAEVAASVGFASESAFYRAFKRELGVSPASWRARTAASDPAPSGDQSRPA